MDFKTALNNYIKKLNCTSKELAIKANLSETVISRYRNGLRTPGVNKDEIKNLANAISAISYEKKINLLTGRLRIEFIDKDTVQIEVDNKSIDFLVETLLEMKNDPNLHHLNFDSDTQDIHVAL